MQSAFPVWDSTKEDPVLQQQWDTLNSRHTHNLKHCDSVITETGSGQLTDSVWFSHILPVLMGHIIALLHFWGSLSDTSRHASMNEGRHWNDVYQFNRARKTCRQLWWSHQDAPQHARPHQRQLILNQWVKRVSWCVRVEGGLVWSWIKK